MPGQRRLHFARQRVHQIDLAVAASRGDHVTFRGKGDTLHPKSASVDPQGRLTLKGARRPYRPDLDRLVPAAASDEFAISTEADRIDPVLEIS